MKDTRLALSIVNTQADVIGSALNGGRIDIYDGERPQWPEDTPKGSLLASALFDDAAFTDAFHGAVEAMIPAKGEIKKAGTPTFARVCRKDGSPVMDVSIGMKGDDANMELPLLTFLEGLTITMKSFSHFVARRTPGA